MKNEYRNSIRNKNLIKKNFLKLIKIKDIDKISIKELMDECDLSRNTFYLHYQDIYAVLEEFQNDTIKHLEEVLDKAKKEKIFDSPLPFLKEVVKTIKENEEEYKILMNVEGSDNFNLKLKDVFMNYIIDSEDVNNLKDTNGFLIFLEILALGTMNLLKECLKDELDITLDDVINETNKMYINGINFYK